MNALRLIILPLGQGRCLATAAPSAITTLRTQPMAMCMDVSGVSVLPRQQRQRWKFVHPADWKQAQGDGQGQRQRTHYLYGAPVADVIKYFQEDSAHSM